MIPKIETYSNGLLKISCTKRTFSSRSFKNFLKIFKILKRSVEVFEISFLNIGL